MLEKIEGYPWILLLQSDVTFYAYNLEKPDIHFYVSVSTSRGYFLHRIFSYYGDARNWIDRHNKRAEARFVFLEKRSKTNRACSVLKSQEMRTIFFAKIAQKYTV